MDIFIAQKTERLFLMIERAYIELESGAIIMMNRYENGADENSLIKFI